MDYIRLTEDADGLSRSEDRAFPMTMGDFAPPAPEMWLSETMAAHTCLFLTLPAGWGGAQHPSSGEQIGICLSGRVQVEAGNGDTREVGAGAIWWMADTTGSGHTTTVLGDEYVRMCIVQPGSAQKSWRRNMHGGVPALWSTQHTKVSRILTL